MSSYPELPPSANPPRAATSPAETPPPAPDGFPRSSELPSRSWPWVIGVLAAGAVALQVWALLSLLSFEQSRLSFEAGVTAWEESRDQRESTAAEWKRIEEEIRQRAEASRERSASLEGTLNALQAQHEQLTASIASQEKALSLLGESETKLEEELTRLEADVAAAEDKRRAAEAAAAEAIAAVEAAKADNTQLAERGRVIRDALAKIETSQQSAQEELESRNRLVAAAEQKLVDTEAQIQKLDALAKDRLRNIAQLQMQQEAAKSLTEENEAARSELETSRAAVEASTTELTAKRRELERAKAEVRSLQTELAVLQTEREGEEQALAQLQAEIDEAQTRLASQRKLERDAASRLTALATTIDQTSTQAADSLTDITRTAAATVVDLSQRAKEVKAAVEALQVPVAALSRGPSATTTQTSSAEEPSSTSDASDEERPVSPAGGTE